MRGRTADIDADRQEFDGFLLPEPIGDLLALGFRDIFVFMFEIEVVQ
ncbi:hypothetical protein [Ensifer sp. 2YAB10]